MEIKIIDQSFSVCELKDLSQVDWASPFCFLGKTDEELSLVCETECVPSNTVDREDGWKAFRIQSILDFSLIGILSRISTILAEEGIGIFAISTYNTDYILVKAPYFSKAITALEREGYAILHECKTV